MRNTLIGAILAAVFIAAIFAAARFGGRPSQGTGMQPQSPSEVAAMIKPEFIGNRLIGGWMLICGPVRELPRSPMSSGPASRNSGEAAPSPEGRPQHFNIPRCRALVALKIPGIKGQEVRITFRQFGFKRALAVFLRFSPNVVEGGDMTTLRFDRADRPIRVTACGSAFCLAIDSIRRSEESALLNSRRITLHFTPRGSAQPVEIPVPADGLAQAIAVIRRIDK